MPYCESRPSSLLGPERHRMDASSTGSSGPMMTQPSPSSQRVPDAPLLGSTSLALTIFSFISNTSWSVLITGSIPIGYTFSRVTIRLAATRVTESSVSSPPSPPNCPPGMVIVIPKQLPPHSGGQGSIVYSMPVCASSSRLFTKSGSSSSFSNTICSEKLEKGWI